MPAFLSRVSFLIGFLLLLVLCGSCNIKSQNQDARKVHVLKTPKGYQMFRNGKPFFIKGASGNSRMVELKAAGANTIRIYDTLGLEEKLTLADSIDLAVVVDIPLQIKNLNEIDLETIDWIDKFVKKYKGHPSLLFWMLGNEVYYPKIFSNDIVKSFNAIVNHIHTLDPDHPVSTAVSTGAIKEILAIDLKSSGIDFISINIFGRINSFDQIKRLLFIWQGPYIFSEWGNNGPWEGDTTKWQAPLEQTSTEKAIQIRDRYQKYIETIDDDRFLGSFAFYWGHKQETTHTWFSLFTEKGQKTQAVFELKNAWAETPRSFRGPKIEKILLNQKIGWESIVCTPGEFLTGNVVLGGLPKNVHFEWEVVPENWFSFSEDYTRKLPNEKVIIEKETITDFKFEAPKTEGSYRLYYTVEADSGYIATANIPFYVLGIDL